MDIPDFLKIYIKNDHELTVVTENILGVSINIDELKRDISKKKKAMIMISGLSGSGKDSIMEKVREKVPGITRVRTMTTRKRRRSESADDDPHIRITFEEFQERIKSGDVLEFVEYAGNYYCTSLRLIREILDAGRTPMLRVDPVGAESFLKKWREGDPPFENMSLLYFFIVPETFEQLRSRLIQRGDDPSTIDDRMEQSHRDALHVESSQYIVVNRTGMLETVTDDVISVLNASQRLPEPSQ